MGTRAPDEAWLCQPITFCWSAPDQVEGEMPGFSRPAESTGPCLQARSSFLRDRSAPSASNASSLRLSKRWHVATWLNSISSPRIGT